LLLLHGAGERGNDNMGNLVHVVSNLFNVKNTPVTDAIIVAPQCPAGNQWVNTPWANGSYDATCVKISNELKAVMEIMDSVEREFSTDYDRYYVMGLSMGGFGTWDLLMRYPDYFAAGVPMCGGADPSMADALVDVPIWTFHGSVDSVVPVSGTREMAAALEEVGSTVFTYEEMAGKDHGIWGTVASRKDVIEWLFAQDLSKR
jgi:predicted peptidase